MVKRAIFYKRPLAFSLCIFLAVFLVTVYISPVVKITVLIASFTLFAVLMLARKRFDKLCGIFFALFLAFGISYLYYDLSLSDIKTAKGENVPVTVKVTEVNYIEDQHCFFDGEIIALKGKTTGILCHFSAENINIALKRGDIINTHVDFEDFSEAGFSANEKNYYYAKGVFLNACISPESSVAVTGFKADVIADIIDSVRGFCSDAFTVSTDKDTASFLSALAIGDKSGLSPSVQSDYLRSGVSHLLALSGMHLAIIMGFVSFICSKAPLGKRSRSCLMIILCICYIIASAFTVSVIRAGAMFIIMSASSFFKRRNDSLTSLFLAAALIVMFSPCSVYDAGFVLSFTSTLGIIIIVGTYMRVRKPAKTRFQSIRNYILLSVITTLSAMSFSIVPMMIYFDSFSLIGVISNIVISPLISLILCLLPILLIVSYIPLISFLIGGFVGGIVIAANFTASLFADISGVLVSLEYPFVIYTLFVYFIGMLIGIIIKHRSALVLSYIIWLTVFLCAVNIYEYSVYDQCRVIASVKGSNDALLLRSQGESCYVDMGKASSASAEIAFYHLLSDLNSCELDSWVICEYTDSYKYTLDRFLAREYVKRIYIPMPEDKNEEFYADEIEYLCNKYSVDTLYYRYTEEFCINDITITVNPPEKLKDSDSKVQNLRLEIKDRVIDYYSKGYFDHGDTKLADADILFVGAHGTAKKQYRSPEISCDTLIFAKNNDKAVSNIERYIQYDLSGNALYCELLIN